MANNNDKNELTVTEQQSGYMTSGANLNELLQDELNGLNITFDRIKIPSGGGLAYELPGVNPDEPISASEFKAVVLYHHPSNSYYKDKYTGGNTPPDCSSQDGAVGRVEETGELKACSDCPLNKFGSGENGGKGCKQKRRLYILREGETLPTIFIVPTGSIADFSKYVMRLLSKGQRTSGVVTRFGLKRAKNAGGIAYSQAAFSAERGLTDGERANIDRMVEQVKKLAGKVVVAEDGEE
jgi:hypothetical protein